MPEQEKPNNHSSSNVEADFLEEMEWARIERKLKQVAKDPVEGPKLRNSLVKIIAETDPELATQLEAIIATKH